MDNQHRKISGYRELNQAEIDLMNEIKTEGKRLQALIDKVMAPEAAPATESKRWAAIAKTDLQKGLMALTRAVAKPDFF